MWVVELTTVIQWCFFLRDAVEMQFRIRFLITIWNANGGEVQVSLEVVKFNLEGGVLVQRN